MFLESDQYLKAKEYTIIKHSGQYRIGGEPYAVHPIEVAHKLYQKGLGEPFVLAGLFHDLLEDTDATKEEIIQLSDIEVYIAVKLVTKEDGYRMKSYMERIMENDIARLVKLADRVHNLESAFVASLEFKHKYIKETKDYYIKMSKNSLFEQELYDAYEALKTSIDS